jgi:BASS family bile acid:Na+ symporter
MADILLLTLKITMIIFMVGNLLDLGIRLDLKAALGGLKNVRFVTGSVLWAFVLCPMVAYGVTRFLPLAPGYAMGFLLLSLAPCAPLLPMVAEKAHADLNYVASFILIAAFGTVIYMPLMVPVVVKGLSVSAWTVAKPLLFLVLIPLVIGVAVRNRWGGFASRIQPFVKKLTGVDTLVMLICVVAIYGKGFIGSIGSWAALAQAIFYTVITAGAYAIGFGMPPGQKSVVSLGICTRNNGAALAPLLMAKDTDPNALVMVSLGIPMMFLFAVIGAKVFAVLAGGREKVAEMQRART